MMMSSQQLRAKPIKILTVHACSPREHWILTREVWSKYIKQSEGWRDERERISSEWPNPMNWHSCSSFQVWEDPGAHWDVWCCCSCSGFPLWGHILWSNECQVCWDQGWAGPHLCLPWQPPGELPFHFAQRPALPSEQGEAPGAPYGHQPLLVTCSH